MAQQDGAGDRRDLAQAFKAMDEKPARKCEGNKRPRHVIGAGKCAKRDQSSDRPLRREFNRDGSPQRPSGRDDSLRIDPTR
jgi:hypothetical protein